ncbi:MAG: hypothetical protein AAF928_00270 [Myxococcota bacterium]
MQPNPYHAPTAPPGFATPPGAGLSTGVYEFGPMEDQVIRTAGSRARIWGVIAFISGLLLVGIGVAAIALTSSLSEVLPPEFATAFTVVGAGILPIALANLVGAFFYFQSGQRLIAVAETQGNDIENMMQALNKLSRAYMIEGILLILATAAGLAISVGMGMGVMGSGFGS